MTLLCAYMLNGISVNLLDSYLESDLNGNSPYTVADVVPNSYVDISSITTWHSVGRTLKDYKYIRNEIMILANTIGWANLSTEEKTIVANLFAVEKVKRDEIYNTNQQVNLGLLHHKNSIEARATRLAIVQMNLFNRLDKADWEEVAIDTVNLLDSYVNHGREGTVEGDLEGLFDYVDGSARTGTSWDGSGSGVGFRDKAYSVEGYGNCSLFADYILDILKNGNY